LIFAEKSGELPRGPHQIQDLRLAKLINLLMEQLYFKFRLELIW
jgi:hypothetical protein